MTQFASRVVNTDPEPYRTQYGTRYPEGGWSFGERIEFTYDPRPEYVLFPSNPINPILVAYREGWMSADEWLVSLSAYEVFGGYVTWDNPENSRHCIVVATEEQREHAQKVLTRLARLG